MTKTLKDFKKETVQRKTTALLQEVVEKVAEAGGQVQAFGEVTKRISSDNPNEESTESLKSTCEQAAVADKNASAAYQEARKALSLKQNRAKVSSLVAELSKLQARLNNLHYELTNH